MGRLRESYSCDSACRVDRAANVIRDVRLAGFVSGNGRRYTREAFAAALHLYEGAKVKLDHGEGETRVSRLFGRVRNVRLAEDGIRGDLHYNPEHPHVGLVLWPAENDPTLLGFSHDVAVRRRNDADGTTVVEAITHVYSVDLVADPATTGGLFEELDMNDELPDDPATDSADHLGQFILSVLKDSGMDAAAKRKKILAALKLMDEGTVEPEPETGDEFTDADEMPAMESLKRLNHRAARWALRKIDGYRVKESQASRREQLRQKCLAARLSESAITDVFLDTLAAANDATVSRLIEDRRTVAAKPAARTSPQEQPKQLTAKELVASMWGN